MLDDYIKEQNIIYKILTNTIYKDKLSHCYLFELNGYNKGFDVALAFAKFLLCPHNYTNKKNCENCSQCKKIDTNNFTELKIIDTDGQWIKKEQLEDLQKEFITKSLIGNKKVYIINNAEKMNVSSANSLLKFLEEPPEGIIAILLTNNMYQLLDTIISRCQVLSFKKNINDSSSKKSSLEMIGEYLYSEEEEKNKFVLEEGLTYVDEIIEYIIFLEENKNETIIYKNKEFIDIFNDRKKIFVAFELFVLYYKDVLNYLLNMDCEYFFDYIDSIKKISKKNNLEKVSKKIKILVELSINIKYNLNSNLLIDKLDILMSEV